MRFQVRTELAPEDVLQRAAEFYGQKANLKETDRSDDTVTFDGRIGRVTVRAHRHYSYTVVEAETDRGVGLDITDMTLRFLYSIPHL